MITHKKTIFANYHVVKPLLALIDYESSLLQRTGFSISRLSIISSALYTIADYPYNSISKSKYFSKMTKYCLYHQWRKVHIEVFNLNRVFDLGTNAYVEQLLHSARTKKMLSSQSSSLFYKDFKLKPLSLWQLLDLKE